jgi:hypothetical protein
MDAGNWPDDLRLSDIEDRFVCQKCGKRGADVRPDWQAPKWAPRIDLLIESEMEGLAAPTRKEPRG